MVRICTFGLLCCIAVSGHAQGLTCRTIDDFAATPVGAWPQGWRPRDGGSTAEASRHTRYVVGQDGERKGMHATYVDSAVTIGRNVPGWDLAQWPILQWRWKAVRLPAGGDETQGGRNDVAASVYVFWQAGLPFRVRSLKFSWSTTLSVGTHYARGFGHYHTRVVESGAAHVGQWRSAQVDVRREFLGLFDEATPAAPVGIAVLTDGDDTDSAAEAWYAEFRLCRR